MENVERQYRVTFESQDEIHILDTKSNNRYIGCICDASNIADKHRVFTPDSVVSALRFLIESKRFTITKKDDCYIFIEFRAELTFAGQPINDSIMIPCAIARCCEVVDDVVDRVVDRVTDEVIDDNDIVADDEDDDADMFTHAFASSSKTVDHRDDHRDRDILSAVRSFELARDVAICEMVSAAEHRFGPIPWFQYDFARMLFAAEFDNDPIIFPVIDLPGNIMAPWARCIIRVAYIDAPLTSYRLSLLRCTRLICTSPTFESRARIIKDRLNRKSFHCCYAEKANNDSRKAATNELRLRRLHPTVRELFITSARRVELREEMSNFAVRSQGLQVTNPLSIIINPRIRPRAIVDDYVKVSEFDGAFANAELVDMTGYDMHTFRTDTLRKELEIAQKRTSGLIIPTCEEDYWYKK